VEIPGRPGISILKALNAPDFFVNSVTLFLISATHLEQCSFITISSLFRIILIYLLNSIEIVKYELFLCLIKAIKI